MSGAQGKKTDAEISACVAVSNGENIDRIEQIRPGGDAFHAGGKGFLKDFFHLETKQAANLFGYAEQCFHLRRLHGNLFRPSAGADFAVGRSSYFKIDDELNVGIDKGGFTNYLVPMVQG